MSLCTAAACRGIRYFGLELQMVVSLHSGTRNWTQVLRKSTKCFQQLSHLSSPILVTIVNHSETFCQVMARMASFPSACEVTGQLIIHSHEKMVYTTLSQSHFDMTACTESPENVSIPHIDSPGPFQSPLINRVKNEIYFFYQDKTFRKFPSASGEIFQWCNLRGGLRAWL